MKDKLNDFRSGLVVFLVALPLCLGIAMAQGAPLFSGILAGIIGGLVVTSISGSQLSVSGPAAGLTAIVVASIRDLGTFDAFLLAVVLAGVMQIILGLLRAGALGNFIPNAVIKGMLAGIGIILIIKQLPHLVGYDADPEGDFEFEQRDGHNTLSDLYYMFNYITPGAVIISAVSMLILLAWDRPFMKKISWLALAPGPLVVVVLGILLKELFDPIDALVIGKNHLVSLPDINTFDDFKKSLTHPDFSAISNTKIWGIAATLAAVASLESLLSLEALDRLDPQRRESPSNRELIAQGTGNIVSGLAGGLPVTSVIVRSSANINAGAKTKLSAIIHALLLLICVLLVPGLLMRIPNAALAAVLIVTGYKLAHIGLFKSTFKKGMDQFLPFVITIAVMLITDLLKGVAAGIVVSIIFILKNNLHFRFEIFRREIEGKVHYLFRLPEHVTFLNKGFVIRELGKVEANSHLTIDGSNTRKIDRDVLEAISEFHERASSRNVQVELLNVTPQEVDHLH